MIQSFQNNKKNLFWLEQSMVSILKINETTMTPEELIEVIRQRRNDSTLEDGVEQKIKEVEKTLNVIKVDSFMSVVLNVW